MIGDETLFAMLSHWEPNNPIRWLGSVDMISVSIQVSDPGLDVYTTLV